jgi:hypothetical protein
MKEHNAFVGLDVHKESIAIAIAEAGRRDEVRFLGEIRNETGGVARLVRKIGRSHPRCMRTKPAVADMGSIVNSSGLVRSVWWLRRRRFRG